jgi:hypothetical protein
VRTQSDIVKQTVLNDFVLSAAKAAGLTRVELRERGMSLYVIALRGDRGVSIGTNGIMFWCTADVHASAMPPDTEVHWAPVGSYARAKILESGDPPPSTSDQTFDSVYLIVGRDAARFARWLDADRRAAFLTYRSLHPTLESFDVTTMTKRVQLRSSSSTYAAEPGERHAFGTGLFTSSSAAAAVLALVELAEVIERQEIDQR